jgi:hypothetical protein
MVHEQERPIKENIGMRILKLNLLAAALLLFGATSASAYAINMVARGSTSSLTTSSTVVVDVFLDADVGLTFFSVSVNASDTTILDYKGPESAALARCGACTGGGASGAQPSYILFTPGSFMMPQTILYPVVSPNWLTWSAPDPGEEQVNIDFVENTFSQATASGTGIWIGSLVWHVTQAFDTTSLFLSMTNGGNIIQSGANPPVPPSDIALSAPIVLTGHLPEPTTAMLIGLGVIGLVVAGRRRA